LRTPLGNNRPVGEKAKDQFSSERKDFFAEFALLSEFREDQKQ
jgi:hypothetical protein